MVFYAAFNDRTSKKKKKKAKVHWHNIQKSSYLKFDPIWSKGYEEMASDGRTKGRKDRLTDEAVTISSPFREHNNPKEEGFRNKIGKKTK